MREPPQEEIVQIQGSLMGKGRLIRWLM